MPHSLHRRFRRTGLRHRFIGNSPPTGLSPDNSPGQIHRIARSGKHRIRPEYFLLCADRLRVGSWSDSHKGHLIPGRESAGDSGHCRFDFGGLPLGIRQRSMGIGGRDRGLFPWHGSDSSFPSCPEFIFRDRQVQDDPAFGLSAVAGDGEPSDSIRPGLTDSVRPDPGQSAPENLAILRIPGCTRPYPLSVYTHQVS